MSKLLVEEITDLVICPQCKKKSKRDLWEEIEEAVCCDLCGSHLAFKCPNCGELFDSIFYKFRYFLDNKIRVEIPFVGTKSEEINWEEYFN